MRPSYVDDTIAAIATPLGTGGLGVVRVSGPNSFQIADRIFRSPKGPVSDAASHTLLTGDIYSTKTHVDHVVASVFRNPHSYTGEDVVEFSCHGSPVVLKGVLDLCFKEGARPAGPGEFTQRAYLNGKMDLAQAEAVADLIHAQSESARAAAMHQLDGILSKRIQEIRGHVMNLLAHLEANLDFVEEDIPGLARKEALGGLTKINDALGSLLKTSLKGRRIREGIRLALIGRPNAGKSSLFNAFLARERAIVTPHPGTTRDVLEETLEWDGMAVVLLDTAGIRVTQDVVEQMGADRARKESALADGVLLVVDASEAPHNDDKNLSMDLPAEKTLILLNKSDQTTEEKISAHQNAFAKFKFCSTAATTGAGLNEVKRRVGEMFGIKSMESGSEPVITNIRHVQLLESAHNHLGAALSEAEKGGTEETMALELRETLADLGQITGDEVTEPLLSAIFGQFCIGK